MELLLQIKKQFKSNQKKFEKNGATDEVMAYAQEVLKKSRMIEFALTGQVFDRILKINYYLSTFGCITVNQLHEIFIWGNFKECLLEFCELKLLQNKTYVSKNKNLITKIMNYGVNE